MGSRCKRSVIWVNWVILTAIYRFWNWRNRPVFTFVTNPRKFYIFLLKICQDLAGKYIAQVSFARWRSSDKQLGPRTVNLVLIPARCYTRILVHASHSWLIYIHFVTGTARKMKAILFSKHRRGPTYTWVYGKGTISWDCIEITLILLNLNVTVHGHNMETSWTLLVLLQVYLG